MRGVLVGFGRLHRLLGDLQVDVKEISEGLTSLQKGFRNFQGGFANF